jgi:TolA-binding protein
MVEEGDTAIGGPSPATSHSTVDLLVKPSEPPTPSVPSATGSSVDETEGNLKPSQLKGRSGVSEQVSPPPTPWTPATPTATSPTASSSSSSSSAPSFSSVASLPPYATDPTSEEESNGMVFPSQVRAKTAASPSAATSTTPSSHLFTRRQTNASTVTQRSSHQEQIKKLQSDVENERKKRLESEKMVRELTQLNSTMIDHENQVVIVKQELEKLKRQLAEKSSEIENLRSAPSTPAPTSSVSVPLTRLVSSLSYRSYYQSSFYLYSQLSVESRNRSSTQCFGGTSK